jgi:hypothetical protein
LDEKEKEILEIERATLEMQNLMQNSKQVLGAST